MFDLSIEKIVVLGLIALFVLGPERLPGALRWLTDALRHAKQLVAAARAELDSPAYTELREPLTQLRQPLEELREPLAQLRALRHPTTGLARDLLETRPAATRDLEGGPVATASSPADPESPVHRVGTATSTTAPGQPIPIDPDAT